MRTRAGRCTPGSSQKKGHTMLSENPCHSPPLLSLPAALLGAGWIPLNPAEATQHCAPCDRTGRRRSGPPLSVSRFPASPSDPCRWTASRTRRSTSHRRSTMEAGKPRAPLDRPDARHSGRRGCIRGGPRDAERSRSSADTDLLPPVPAGRKESPNHPTSQSANRLRIAIGLSPLHCAASILPRCSGTSVWHACRHLPRSAITRRIAILEAVGSLTVRITYGGGPSINPRLTPRTPDCPFVRRALPERHLANYQRTRPGLRRHGNGP